MYTLIQHTHTSPVRRSVLEHLHILTIIWKKSHTQYAQMLISLPMMISIYTVCRYINTIQKRSELSSSSFLLFVLFSIDISDLYNGVRRFPSFNLLELRTMRYFNPNRNAHLEHAHTIVVLVCTRTTLYRIYHSLRLYFLSIELL